MEVADTPVAVAVTPSVATDVDAINILPQPPGVVAPPARLATAYGGLFAPEPTCRRFYYVGYTFSRPFLNR